VQEYVRSIIWPSDWPTQDVGGGSIGTTRSMLRIARLGFQLGLEVQLGLATTWTM